MKHLNNLERALEVKNLDIFIDSPAPWAGHIPFASWLVQALHPKVLVELGSYSGISYFSFCQSIQHNNLNTKAHAIDTWVGDIHAGLYDRSVFDGFLERNEPFSRFSTWHRCTFDDALSKFGDQTIDLLHIDGLHTYEAVKHDFNTWRPKLTDDAIVLFHDTAVRTEGFGVHKFWRELLRVHQGFEFSHSHGLGVLFISSSSVSRFLENGFDFNSPEELQLAQSFFEMLGSGYELQSQLIHTNSRVRDLEHDLIALDETRLALMQVEALRDRLTKTLEQSYCQAFKRIILRVLQQLKRLANAN